MGALLLFFPLVSFASKFRYNKWHGCTFVVIDAAFFAYMFAADFYLRLN